jgi:hypothetical protein
MIEAAVVARYVIAWAVRNARRAAGRLDAEVNTAIDAGLDNLHDVVAAKLRTHPVLDDLAKEAATEQGQISGLTRQQVELAVTAAAHKDDVFGRAVTDLLAQVRAAEQASGVSVLAGAGSRVFTGNVHVNARGGGIAFGQVAGDIHTRERVYDARMATDVARLLSELVDQMRLVYRGLAD